MQKDETEYYKQRCEFLEGELAGQSDNIERLKSELITEGDKAYCGKEFLEGELAEQNEEILKLRKNLNLAQERVEQEGKIRAGIHITK